MKTINFLLCSILVCLSFFLSHAVVAAEEAPPVTAPAVTATPAAPVATADEAAAQQTLRAYLQMQDQLHATQRAIEESRKENEAASKRNAEAIGARLTVIEQSLAVQRQRALESTQNSNRILLLLVGTLAGIAVLAMICTAWFQTRAMGRMTEVSEALRQIATFSQPLALAAPGGTSLMHTSDAVDQSSTRFLGDLDRLQKRIQELETSLAVPPTNGVISEIPAPASRVGLLIGKGETLLKLEQAGDALACFEEALALEPANIEALLKKGTALEQLERTEEAIVSYDRAISFDHSATAAYLFKGGAFNRLKRYAEALECYEQALVKQKSAAA